LRGHKGTVPSITYFPDGKRMISGSADKTTRLWDLEEGKEIEEARDIHEQEVMVSRDVRFSHDSKKLIVKSWRNHLEVWGVRTHELDVEVGAFGRMSKTSTPVFWITKDKNIVAASAFSYYGFLKTIYEFDASTLNKVEPPFEGHTKAISSLALSLDCALLASVSYDNTIKLWAFDSRQLLA
ncbi:WD40 repeat-like protein, partial [Suillus decipiens]